MSRVKPWWKCEYSRQPPFRVHYPKRRGTSCWRIARTSSEYTRRNSKRSWLSRRSVIRASSSTISYRSGKRRTKRQEKGSLTALVRKNFCCQNRSLTGWKKSIVRPYRRASGRCVWPFLQEAERTRFKSKRNPVQSYKQNIQGTSQFP